ncbi:hypothetical protein KP509_09G059700 [Ceratopteris richardii]|uniref:Uncharacterized protein n=1 Tax=Ceratopteris richardii TaxID=49495 RepID=A0A8T2U6T8_CERRI|nr:hypothetical protein KP509_09G059700 [Ceratopteris richardii]
MWCLVTLMSLHVLSRTKHSNARASPSSFLHSFIFFPTPIPGASDENAMVQPFHFWTTDLLIIMHKTKNKEGISEERERERGKIRHSQINSEVVNEINAQRDLSKGSGGLDGSNGLVLTSEIKGKREEILNRAIIGMEGLIVWFYWERSSQSMVKSKARGHNMQKRVSDLPSLFGINNFRPTLLALRMYSVFHIIR